MDGKRREVYDSHIKVVILPGHTTRCPTTGLLPRTPKPPRLALSATLGLRPILPTGTRDGPLSFTEDLRRDEYSALFNVKERVLNVWVRSTLLHRRSSPPRGQGRGVWHTVTRVKERRQIRGIEEPTGVER